MASRCVRSDQAKMIILVLAYETCSRFVMMSPMFSDDHRKVDGAGFKTESDII